MPSVRDETESGPLYPPFLLFPGEGSKQVKKDLGDQTVFSAPFDELDECPVGLWLDRSEPWGGRGGEDEAVLVVPFDFPGKACKPFEAGSGLPLFTLLEEWTEMVKSGRWEVDERGVVGGLDLFREMGKDEDEKRGRSKVRDTMTLAQ